MFIASLYMWQIELYDNCNFNRFFKSKHSSFLDRPTNSILENRNATVIANTHITYLLFSFEI